MIKTIKSMYAYLQSCIRLNVNVTDWFSVDSGVHGDNMAPTLFALFINDLSLDVNSLHCGIKLNKNLEISILMYADDIVLISDTEENLQCQLSKLMEWSAKYNLFVNCDKMKILQARKPSNERSKYKFVLDNTTVDYTSRYRIYDIRHDRLFRQCKRIGYCK